MKITSTKRRNGKLTMYHDISIEFTGAEALAIATGATPKFTRDSVLDATKEALVNAIKAMVGA